MERHVSASTQNQASSAILFLYRYVLNQEVPWLEDLVRAKRPQRLPVVCTRDEVKKSIGSLEWNKLVDGGAAVQRRIAVA